MPKLSYVTYTFSEKISKKNIVAGLLKGSITPLVRKESTPLSTGWSTTQGLPVVVAELNAQGEPILNVDAREAYSVFGFRMDEKRVNNNALKLELTSEFSGKSVSSRIIKERKEALREELLLNADPTSKWAAIIMDSNNKKVHICSTSSRMQDFFFFAFDNSFSQMLTRLDFNSLISKPVPASFGDIGEEFLTWLLLSNWDEDNTKVGNYEFVVEPNVKCSNSSSFVACRGDTKEEVSNALKNSMKVQQLALTFSFDDINVTFNLTNKFEIKALEIPLMELSEKIDLMTKVSDTVSKLFSVFLETRFQ